MFAEKENVFLAPPPHTRQLLKWAPIVMMVFSLVSLYNNIGFIRNWVIMDACEPDK